LWTITSYEKQTVEQHHARRNPGRRISQAKGYHPIPAGQGHWRAPRRINEIVNGLRANTADTALRLGRYFAMSPEFWLNLQSHYDLEQERERLAKRLDREVKVLAAA
jgi:hypothetical protein